MQDTKLLKLLRALPPEEFRQLRRFAQPGFFNTDPLLARLCEVLASHHPAFDSKALAKERVFAKVFPDQPFAGGKWRNLLTKMTKLVEDCLVCLELREDDFFRNTLLARAFARRNRFEQMEKTILERLAELDKHPLPDSDLHFEAYLLNRDLFFRPESKKRAHYASLERNTLHSLNRFHLLEQQRLRCIVANDARLLGDASLAEAVDEMPPDLAASPLFLLFSKIAELYQTGEMRLFFEAKNALLAGIDRMRKVECQIALPMLVNFAMAESSKDERAFVREIFDLYKLGLQHDVLLVDGKMTDTTFLTIAVTGSKLNEFAWVDDFIKNHERLIGNSSRLPLRRLAMASWHFYRGAFSKAIEELTGHDDKLPRFALNARSLLLRSHFEVFLSGDRTYHGLLLSECESFAKFLKRSDDLLENKKMLYSNLIFFVKKLVAAHSQPNLTSDHLSKLTSLLNSYSSVAARTWLEEKLDELKRKKARAR